MVLGINWYRKFPDGLYDYKYFKFKNSPGGFADYPAELEAQIQTDSSEIIKQQIETLVKQHSQARLFLKIKNNTLRIMIGWYSLFDYDFCLANEVEKILIQHNAAPIYNADFSDAQLLKLGNHNFYNNFKYPTNEHSSIVYSAPGPSNAITSSFRVDCNVSKARFNELVHNLNEIGDVCKFNSIYISQMQSELKERTNLFIFFTNGRQGQNLNDMIISDGNTTEKMVNTLASSGLIKFGQIGNWKYGPDQIKTIVRIEDKNFHTLLNL